MTGKTAFIFLFLFLLSAFVFSSDIEEELKPNPVRKGYQFTLRFYIDYDNPLDVGIKAPSFPKVFRLVRGPYVRSYFKVAAQGKRIKKTRISYTFLASKTGRYIIDSFEIKAGGRIYHTAPQIMEVGVYKNRHLVVPFDISWEVDNPPYYVGQAIPLVLVVKNLPNILMFDDVAVTPPSSGLFSRMNDPGPITKRTVGLLSLYRVPAAGYIFTPSKPGRITIPSARLSATGISGVASRVKLQVVPIPKALELTGAIGKFDRFYSMDSDKFEVNKDINVRVTVKGTGNLNYLEIPEPRAEGLSIVGRKDEESYSGSLHGFTGERTKIFVFSADTEGAKQIEIPAFVYMDPGAGVLKTVPSGKINLSIKSSKKTGEQEGFDFDKVFFPEKVSVSPFTGKVGKYLDWESYLWMIPGPAIFLIFFITEKRKALTILMLVFVSLRGFGGTNSDGTRMYHSGNYKDAAESFVSQISDHPFLPELCYNAALSYYKAGDIGRAVYYTEIASFYSPFKKKYSMLLDFLVKSAGIEYSIAPPSVIYPDTFLFILTLLVNAAGITGVIYLVKRKNIYFIAAVLLVGFSVITAGGLFYSSAQWRLQYGVAQGSSVQVKKIPVKDSGVKFTIKTGETVRVVDSAGDYDFVENGLGIKGWVKKGNLLVWGGSSNPAKILTGR